MTPANRRLRALGATSLRLARTVASLGPAELAAPSGAEGWSIARVLSHLGSGTEVCTGLVARGLAGDTRGPDRRDMLAVGARWDALSPWAQRDAWLQADRRHRELLGSLGEAELRTARVPYPTGLLDVAGYLGHRLSEQALRAWDIEVALDASATVPPAETALLWERIDLVAGRYCDADTRARLAPHRIRVRLTDTGRTLFLDIGEELHLFPVEPVDPTGLLAGPAEAVLRLLHGRGRPTDPVTTEGPVTVDDLRALFPGL
ncbi:maleylpyruvate isomerase N-terminal domain-containing protein [Streptomyces sp. TS71-3]|uniref:maleylpyruvate isomerase N-terminal domain-containing protein n=1 Tax=Streptomyces sp. TS71-3 TaxID=2733862 RepID=UPI001B29FCFC|nr:maleylpyruvate isomerase N-terminal domain-containing protein [Streptomyces sp. TS71-3]GHJ36879.1 hypothetical protein Sm713_24880 [Streptomyces sp. TS71-3]